MNRPLTLILLFYCLGIGLGLLQDISPGLLFALGAILAACLLLRRGARPLNLEDHAGLAALLIILGWLNAELRQAAESPHDVRSIIGAEPRYGAFIGEIRRPPRLRARDFDSPEQWRAVFELRLSHLQLEREAPRPAAGIVLVNAPNTSSPDFFAGQRVRVTGVIAAPDEPRFPGQFDYRRFLARRGIHYEVRVKSAADYEALNEGRKIGAPERFQRWAMKALAKGVPVEDDALRLIWAMTLGWRTALTPEVKEPFVQSGALHIFAISGLHVALLVKLAEALLESCRVPRRWFALILIPAIWFYTAAVGWQPSASRASVMMSVIMLGWMLARPPDLTNSLALAAIILLVWEPRQLSDAGFQLSFCVVLSLAFYAELSDRFWKRWDSRPQWAPAQRSWWRSKFLSWTRRAIHTLGATAAAWIGSLPLVALYFGIVSPSGLLSNLLIIPLSGLALSSAAASLLFASWLLDLSVLLNHSAWFWMTLMIEISQAASSAPGSFFPVPPVSGGACLCFYLGLLWSAFFPFKRPVLRFGPAAILLIASFTWFVGDWQEQSEQHEITVLPGAAIVIDSPGQSDDMLVDAGSREQARYVTLPFLRSQGRLSLATLILTHGDAQHTGGASWLAGQIEVDQVITSPASFRSPSYREFVSSLESSPLPRWKRVAFGDTIHDWEILHPSPDDKFSLADDSSLVLRSRWGGPSVMLLGDLGRLGQRKIFDRADDLRADIIIASIPAAGEPIVAPLLEKIRPKLIIISSNNYPASDRASAALRRRLEQSNAQVLFTSDHGAVTIRLSGRSFKIQQ